MQRRRQRAPCLSCGAWQRLSSRRCKLPPHKAPLTKPRVLVPLTIPRRCPVDQVCLQEGQPPQYGQLNFNNLATGLVYNFFIITTLWWGMVSQK